MPSILVHETTDASGQPRRIHFACEHGSSRLIIEGETLPLPEGALDAVMRRFGKPLGVDESAMMIDERLDLGDGRALVRFRFLARYDVIARDYLVLYPAAAEEPASAPPEEAAEPLCELATSVTAALEHLARRFAATA